jgi:YD repeat-containing protein
LSGDGVSYARNSLNQYTAVGEATFSYDFNGNLSSDGIGNYTYDEANRLSSAVNGGVNATYTYDAFNRRMSKTVNGVTTYYLHDGDEIIAEYDGTDSVQAEYVHGDRIDEVLTMDRGGNGTKRQKFTTTAPEPMILSWEDSCKEIHWVTMTR